MTDDLDHIPEEPVVMPDDLEGEEDSLTDDVPQPKWRINSLTDVDRVLARIRWAREHITSLTELYDAEVKRLEERRAKALKAYQRVIDHYAYPVEEFTLRYLGGRTKNKQEILPNGTIALRSQQPDYDWGDKAMLVAFLINNHVKGVLRPKVEADLAQLKERIVIRDGAAMVANIHGEVVELPVVITKRGPKVSVKTEG